MVQPRDEVARALVVAARLDRERALARRRRHPSDVEVAADPVGDAQAVEPGRRQHERVGLPRIEPSQTRVDVAVDRMDQEIGAPGEEEGTPAWAVRPDT